MGSMKILQAGNLAAPMAVHLQADVRLQALTPLQSGRVGNTDEAARASA
jgi:hypothetical protein